MPSASRTSPRSGAGPGRPRSSSSQPATTACSPGPGAAARRSAATRLPRRRSSEQPEAEAAGRSRAPASLSRRIREAVVAGSPAVHRPVAPHDYHQWFPDGSHGRHGRHTRARHRHDVGKRRRDADGVGPARSRGPLPLLQPRALLARLQRPRPAAGRGRVGSPARAGQVLCDLGVEPGRVLHGPRGQPRGSAGGRPRRPRARRPERGRAGRCDPRAGDRAARPRERRVQVAARRACGARRARAAGGRGVGGGAQGARRPLRAAGLPGADSARDRPGAAVPVHLQSLAQPRRPPARPGAGRRGPGAREGAEGAPRPLPAARRGRGHAGPARRPDRRQPRGALPGDGSALVLVLPGDARHRLRRLRRGRRPPSGRRGGAPPPPLRRGRAAGGRGRDGRTAAVPARRGNGPGGAARRTR